MKIRIVDIASANEAREAVAATGADSYAVPVMAQKGVFRAVELKGVDNRAANLLKQEMLSLGAEAAVSHVISRFEKGISTVLLLGTLSHFNRLLPKLKKQPFTIKDIGLKISRVLSNYEINKFTLSSGKKKIQIGNSPVLMGILNVTPDSFSDGGRYNKVDAAVEHGICMSRLGAGIIDVGGQSTRPGAKAVGAKDEAARVVPVICALAKKIRAPISVDTFQPEVAKAALDAGATMINDITALRFKGGAMASLVARRKTPVALMHMQGTPGTMQKNPQYNDVVGEITDFFEERIKFAVDKGIARNQIILDPGIGFGKTVAHNLIILRRLREFTVLGMPLLVGLSNKSFIGKIAGMENPWERLPGSLCGSIWSALNGAAILRVHDVYATAQAVKILSAIRKSRDAA